MNKKDLNSLEMFRTVDALFKQQPLVWNIFPPLNDVYGSFILSLNEVEKLSLIQKESDTIGLTLDKNDRRKELAKLAFYIAVKMRAYAKINKNNTLREAVRYTMSQLLKCTEQEFLNRCFIIHSQGLSNINNLSAFNLFPEDLTHLNDAIQTYKPLTAARNLTDDAGNSAKKMSVLIREANISLDILTDTTYALVTETNFLESYEKARKINNRRSRGATTVEEVEMV